MTRAWLLLLPAAACTNIEASDCETQDQFEAFVDDDGDGFGTGEPVMVCVLTEGLADNRIDCDDTSSTTFPGAEEMCNQVDDNCDGQIDESYTLRTYFADVDGDGFGGLFPAVTTCGAPPEGYVDNSNDCNDDVASINPAALEVCNDNVDDNCNGLADDADPTTSEDSLTTFYEDNDADGFGALTRPEQRCQIRAGLVDNFTDCDDRTNQITNFPQIEDADQDGYGDDVGTVMSCPGHPGTADNRDDCDDNDPWVNIPKPWYTDIDGDGYGEGDPESFGCFPPNNVLVGPFFGDCDDGDASIHADAKEICGDGIDQNCNGRTDCEDSECAVVEECWLDCVDIGLAAEVPVNYEVDNYAGWGNNYTIPCTYGSGPDVTIQWTAPEDGSYTFDTYGSDNRFGPGLALYDGCEDNAASYGCNLFSYNRGLGYYQAQIRNVSLDEGETVIIKMDSYYGYTTDGVLNITKN